MDFTIKTNNVSQVRAMAKAAKAKALVSMGIQAMGDIQGITPVDTGNLRNSIHYHVDGDTMAVGTDVEYAAYVECGTRYMAAQPYVKPGVMNNISAHERIIADAFGELGG